MEIMELRKYGLSITHTHTHTHTHTQCGNDGTKEIWAPDHTHTHTHTHSHTHTHTPFPAVSWPPSSHWQPDVYFQAGLTLTSMDAEINRC